VGRVLYTLGYTSGDPKKVRMVMLPEDAILSRRYFQRNRGGIANISQFGQYFNLLGTRPLTKCYCYCGDLSASTAGDLRGWSARACDLEAVIRLVLDTEICSVRMRNCVLNDIIVAYFIDRRVIVSA
jgi:hypothetical protein